MEREGEVGMSITPLSSHSLSISGNSWIHFVNNNSLRVIGLVSAPVLVQYLLSLCLKYDTASVVEPSKSESERVMEEGESDEEVKRERE